MKRLLMLALLLAAAAPVQSIAQSSGRSGTRLPIDAGRPRQQDTRLQTIVDEKAGSRMMQVFLHLTSISHVQPEGSLRREPIKFGTRQVAFLRTGADKPVQIVCLQKNVSGCSEPPYFSGGLVSSARFSFAMPQFKFDRLRALAGSAIVIRTDFAALYPVNGQGVLQRLPAEQEDWIMLADLLKAAETSREVPHRVVVRFNGHIFHYNYVLHVSPLPAR